MPDFSAYFGTQFLLGCFGVIVINRQCINISAYAINMTPSKCVLQQILLTCFYTDLQGNHYNSRWHGINILDLLPVVFCSMGKAMAVSIRVACHVDDRYMITYWKGVVRKPVLDFSGR